MAENGNAWAINLDNEWNAAQLRQLAGAHMLPSGALSSITGKRPGTGFGVSVNGSNQPVVAAGVGQVAGPADGDGCYAVCVPAAVTLGTAIPLAGGGLKRHDRMVVRVRDADVPALATALREVSVERIVGTETAGTPSPPSEPLGCLTVGLIEVTSTTRVVLAHSVPRYAALGGIVPVASSTARDALPAYDGLMVYREDTDIFEGRIAGAWAAVVKPPTIVTNDIDEVAGSGNAITEQVIDYDAAHKRVTLYVAWTLGQALASGPVSASQVQILTGTYRPKENVFFTGSANAPSAHNIWWGSLAAADGIIRVRQTPGAIAGAGITMECSATYAVA